MALLGAPSGEATSPTRALSRSTLIYYAVPAVGPGFFYNLIVVMYLNFATDQLGASAAVVGSIFAASKIWDAVSDPIAGSLSDRTRTRLGRRRSWLLGAAVPVAIFSLMAWAPPQGLVGYELSLWIAVSVFGFYTAYTAIDVPHMALGAELTVDDPAGRNRLYAWRQLLRTGAMFLAFGIGTFVIAQPETGRQGAFWLALAGGAFTIVSVTWCVFALPPERPDFIARAPQSPFRAIGDVARNRLARLLLFVFFIESMGIGAIGVLVPYVIRYVMELPPGFIPAMLLVYVGSTLVAIPIWVRLARTYEKRHLWLFSMIQGGLGFGMMLFVEQGGWPVMVVASLIAGSAGACGNTLGQSLKADLIDVDEHRSGERKEGAYFAAWSFANKLAAGIMIFVVGIVLEAVGYVPNVDQPQEVRHAIIMLMAGLPLAGYGIGALAFRRFDLSEADHSRIRAELDARR